MSLSPDMFLNPYVLVYIVVIIAGQWIYFKWQKASRNKTTRQRNELGLPPDILINHSERLSDRRQDAFIQSGLLLVTVFLTPFILIALAALFSSDKSASTVTGLSSMFIVLIVWVLISGTDVSKAFLGGLAFKTLVAHKVPFQVGDRVTLRGISGRVTAFDTFFVTLQTPNDDSVSVPSASLWLEPLVSANAGERASLCVMEFYLAPFVNDAQRQAVEDAIWNAIQASVYFDSAQPVQIYLSQNPDSLQLTAKAYVALTFNEPLFVSDVTRAFLKFAADNKIALASSAWPEVIDTLMDMKRIAAVDTSSRNDNSSVEAER